MRWICECDFDIGGRDVLLLVLRDDVLLVLLMFIFEVFDVFVNDLCIPL
jgi:hypothetical protein